MIEKLIVNCINEIKLSHHNLGTGSSIDPDDVFLLDLSPPDGSTFFASYSLTILSISSNYISHLASYKNYLKSNLLSSVP